MKQIKLGLTAFVLVVFIFSGCKKDNSVYEQDALASKKSGFVPAISTYFSEGFETGTKTSYSAANVTLGTGIWYFDDALIGNTTSDRKTGVQSARIRNIGSLAMGFNITNGASTVTISHAVFGTDGASTWKLLASTNGGSTYTQIGTTITSSSTTLQTVSFTVNIAGNIRFKILKASGGTNRVNIDNVVISAYSTSPPPPPDNDNLLLGNPSKAAAIIDSANNYLMVKKYYDVCYNKKRGEPNWVSWHLYSGDLGLMSRMNNFRADTTLPSGWYEVGTSSYVGSGFDRGHNCPSGDRTIDSTANSATFLMTNMIPQAPNNNEQTWANMENYIRTQISAGLEAYIVMGSYGIGGTGSNGYATTIDNGNVTVPANIWKVVVLLPNGNNDISRIDTTVRVITVNVPNNNTVNSDWKVYRTSVHAIEVATGYNLLSNLPLSVQTVLKAKIDNQ